MADITLPVPGESPNWGTKLNTAILRINQDLEGLGVRVSLAESGLSSITLRVTNLEGRVTDLEDNLEDVVRDIAADVIANDPTIIAAAEAAVDQALEDADVMTAAHTTATALEWVDGLGYVHLAVDGVSHEPRLRGSRAPSVDHMSPNGIEILDANGFVVETLSGSSADGGGSFRESHVILLAGQSNMWGANGPIPAGSNEPLPNLFVVPQTGSSTGTIVQAVEPLVHPYFATSGTRGPGWAFARRYALEHPDVRVVIVPCAVPGTGMWGSDPFTWAPSREGEAGINNLFVGAINRANQAVTTSGASRVAAILWHQGERDSTRGSTGSGTPGTQYAAQLDALVAGFRSRITGAANAPFLVGQLGLEYRQTAGGTVNEINAAHEGIVDRVSGSGFAPAPPAGYLASDQIHFTGEGYELLADNLWDAYRPALYNI